MKTVSYEKSLVIAEIFYISCLEFWKGDSDLALRDTALLKTNPFSPNGDPLSREAIIDYVNKMLFSLL